MDQIFRPEFWDNSYINKSDLWSLNSVSPVFVHLLRLNNFLPMGKLLIPGSGISYDAILAAKKGYDVSIMDFSSSANEITKRFAIEQNVNLTILEENLFHLGKNHSKEFNLIYEYVTFCAVPNNKLEEMVSNFSYSLVENGIMATVLFPIDPRPKGPPFSIDLNFFLEVSFPYFELLYLNKLIPSVKPRRKKEILLIMRKKGK